MVTGEGIVVDQKQISADEAAAILLFEEGHYLDLKRIEIKPAKLSQSISAFANTSGGELFIGVPETEERDGSKKRDWAGFKDMEEANAHFQVLESLGALGNHFTAEFLAAESREGLVLHLTVPKSKDIIRATDGVPYIRRNAQNLPIDTEEGLRRLELDKGVVTFEDETIDIPQESLTNSAVMIGFMLEVVPSAEPDVWLQSQFVLVGHRPTVAGTLLFSDVPQAALPKSARQSRFSGTNRRKRKALGRPWRSIPSQSKVVCTN